MPPRSALFGALQCLPASNARKVLPAPGLIRPVHAGGFVCFVLSTFGMLWIIPRGLPLRRYIASSFAKAVTAAKVQMRRCNFCAAL